MNNIYNLGHYEHELLATHPKQVLKSTPFNLSVMPLYLYCPWQAGQVTPSPCIFREHLVTTLLILYLVRREGYVVGLQLHPQIHKVFLGG